MRNRGDVWRHPDENMQEEAAASWDRDWHRPWEIESLVEHFAGHGWSTPDTDPWLDGRFEDSGHSTVVGSQERLGELSSCS